MRAERGGGSDPVSPAGQPGTVAVAAPARGGGTQPASSWPRLGLGTATPLLCLRAGDAMQMTGYEKIKLRMLSTRLTDSCQNILPSSFITHHFRATAQHSDTVLTGTLQYLKDSLIDVKNVRYEK